MKPDTKFKYTIAFIAFIIASCTRDQISSSGGIDKSVLVKDWSTAAAKPVSAVTYLTGDPADVAPGATGGLLLMGGGTDVDAAIQWFLNRSGGGDIVVIRATGADGYNQYMYNMVPVNSVETIIIDSRAKAALPSVITSIRNAEALFIAGGDQWDYVNYWKDTPVEDAINYLINTKHVTIGGTSAGLAVLGQVYFSAQVNTVTSDQALKDPYNRYMTLGRNDFVNYPIMANTITDSHYSQRTRQGRHITFLARMMKDWSVPSVRGIGIDEQTAVCMDQNGIGSVYGINDAYFLQNENLGPETCVAGTSLTWYRSGLAIKAYKIRGSLAGNGSFNANTWALTGGTTFHYVVTAGVLAQN